MAVTSAQDMLLRLDRKHRLAHSRDAALGLPSHEAASVLKISPEVYRERVSRARHKLMDFRSWHVF